MRISFNRPPFVGKETEYIKEAVEKNGMICGDGPFTKKCSQWMKDRFQTKNVLLTTSCTHALEMAAFLADIQPGDEVIMRRIPLYPPRMLLFYGEPPACLWTFVRIP